MYDTIPKKITLAKILTQRILWYSTMTSMTTAYRLNLLIVLIYCNIINIINSKFFSMYYTSKKEFWKV